MSNHPDHGGPSGYGARPDGFWVPTPEVDPDDIPFVDPGGTRQSRNSRRRRRQRANVQRLNHYREERVRERDASAPLEIALEDAVTLNDMLYVKLPVVMKKRAMYMRKLCQIVDAHIKMYRKEEPPQHIINTAMDLRESLITVRCLQWETLTSKNVVTPDTKLTDNVLLWLVCAKLTLLVFNMLGASHGYYSAIYNNLQQQDIRVREGLKDARVVLYTDPICTYSMGQLSAAYFALRTRWRVFSLSQKATLGKLLYEYVELLDIRASYFVCHVGGPQKFDVPAYVKCPSAFADLSARYICTEKFMLDMEASSYVLQRDKAMATLFARSSCYSVHTTLQGNKLWNRRRRATFMNKRGNIPFFYEVHNGQPWLCFKKAMTTLAEQTTSRRELGFFSDQFLMSACLPVGELVVYENFSKQAGQAVQLMSYVHTSMGATHMRDSMELLDVNGHMAESLARAEAIHCQSSVAVIEENKLVLKYREHIQDLLFVYLFNKFISICKLQWMEYFFCHADTLAENRKAMDVLPYPKVVMLLNVWHVYHDGTMWEVDEIASACFLWLYIVYYSYDGEICISSSDFDVRKCALAVFGSDGLGEMMQALGISSSESNTGPALCADDVGMGDIVE